MSDRKTVRALVALEFEVDANLPPEAIRDQIEAELAEFSGSSGASGAQLLNHEFVDLEAYPGFQNYTVCFFLDGDRAVEHFSQHVVARSESDAWKAAVRQARASGCSSSGHNISAGEWSGATEITTLRGHNLTACRFGLQGAPMSPPADPEDGRPLVGDEIIQTINGYDVSIEIANVPDVTGRGLPSGVWEIEDQYGDSHLVERDGDDWVTVNPARADIPVEAL